MSTFTRLLLIIVLSLMLVHPALAQEPTSEGEPTAVVTDAPTLEPTPVVEPPVEDEPPVVDSQLFIAVLLVLVVVLVVGGFLLDTALKGAFNSIPVVARGPIKTIIEGVLDQMRGIVEGTPDMTDDALLKIIDERVREIIRDELPAIVAAAAAKAQADAMPTRGYSTPSS